MAEYTPLHANHDKLRKVFARLDANDESGRQVAYTLAGRALKDMGISWSDLLEAHIAPKGIRSDNLRSTADANRAFNDIFEGIFNDPNSPFSARAQHQVQNQEQSRRTYIDGANSPPSIVGSFIIDSEHQIRTGRMLYVTVRDRYHVYGPFAVFGDDAIDLIKSEPNKLWLMTVRQPRFNAGGGRHLATLVNIRAA